MHPATRHYGHEPSKTPAKSPAREAEGFARQVASAWSFYHAVLDRGHGVRHGLTGPGLFAAKMFRRSMPVSPTNPQTLLGIGDRQRPDR